ncbi:hypothetical protein FVE85_3214 [Porphyridium purpureum]|uniref:Uncharacterized protein n=1 Tax=Porphyridium purpureum TaxID=35688 RepID=A0A5J4YW53_PORPP|nr:hypothetical protein FVE85_3214 [Porphyridium purpureum]|eukprot:POR6695..scf227_4
MADKMARVMSTVRGENVFSFINQRLFGARGFKGLAQAYYDKYVATNTLMPLVHYASYAFLFGYALEHSHLKHVRKHEQEEVFHIPSMPTEADV